MDFSKITFGEVCEVFAHRKESELYQEMSSYKKVGCDLLYGGIIILNGVGYLLDLGANMLYRFTKKLMEAH